MSTPSGKQESSRVKMLTKMDMSGNPTELIIKAANQSPSLNHKSLCGAIVTLCLLAPILAYLQLQLNGMYSGKNDKIVSLEIANNYAGEKETLMLNPEDQSMGKFRPHFLLMWFTFATGG